MVGMCLAGYLRRLKPNRYHGLASPRTMLFPCPGHGKAWRWVAGPRHPCPGQRGVRTMTTPPSSPPTGSGLTTVSMAVDVRRASPGGRSPLPGDRHPGPRDRHPRAEGRAGPTAPVILCDEAGDDGDWLARTLAPRRLIIRDPGHRGRGHQSRQPAGEPPGQGGADGPDGCDPQDRWSGIWSRSAPGMRRSPRAAAISGPTATLKCNGRRGAGSSCADWLGCLTLVHDRRHLHHDCRPRH